MKNETREIQPSKIEIQYEKTSDIGEDIEKIIDSAGQFARKFVNVTLVQRNWLLGKRIAEEELEGKDRAEYGTKIIVDLSKRLTKNMEEVSRSAISTGLSSSIKAFHRLCQHC